MMSFLYVHKQPHRMHVKDPSGLESNGTHKNHEDDDNDNNVFILSILLGGSSLGKL